MSEGAFIQGKVTMKSGDKIIFQNKTNHFVDHALLGIMSILASKTASINLPTYTWNIIVGTDTTTLTTHNMTDLVAPIQNEGVSIAPNIKNVFLLDDSANNHWGITFNAIWNAGTISGTIGEMGLWLLMPNNTTFQWTSNTPVSGMASRLSVADSDISAILIDDTTITTLDWDIDFQF